MRMDAFLGELGEIPQQHRVLDMPHFNIWVWFLFNSIKSFITLLLGFKVIKLWVSSSSRVNYKDDGRHSPLQWRCPTRSQQLKCSLFSDHWFLRPVTPGILKTRKPFALITWFVFKITVCDLKDGSAFYPSPISGNPDAKSLVVQGSISLSQLFSIRFRMARQHIFIPGQENWECVGYRHLGLEKKYQFQSSVLPGTI